MKENITLAIPVIDDIEVQAIEAREVEELFYNNSNGVVIVQETNDCAYCSQGILGFWFCNPFLSKYELGSLPPDKTILDEQKWFPSMKELKAIQKTHEFVESGSTTCKCLKNLVCLNSRSMKMKLKTKQQNINNVLVLSKSFSCGGKLCCPHTGVVKVNDKIIGRIVESWRLDNLFTWCTTLMESIFCCRVPYNVQVLENEVFVNKYRINVRYCSFFGYINDCMVSPCCHDFSMKVYKEDELFGQFKRTNGKYCSLNSCSRWYCGNHSNYIVEWKDNTSINDRTLFIGATMLFDFLYFDGYGPKLIEKCICSSAISVVVVTCLFINI